MWRPWIFLQEIPCDWPDDGHITPPSSATQTGLNGHRLRNDVLAVFARHAVVGASRLATLAMIAPVGGPLRIQAAMLVMWRSKSSPGRGSDRFDGTAPMSESHASAPPPAQSVTTV
jgi:hypothetical protein